MKKNILFILTILLINTAVFAGENEYEKKAFGFKAFYEEGMKIGAELEREDKCIVSFALPKVWSDIEERNIENGIALIAYKGDDVSSVDDLIAMERERIADVLISSEDTNTEFGPGFISITQINGLFYKTGVTFIYENGIGYIIAFSSTEGTYDKNLEKYHAFMKKLKLFPPQENE